MSGLKILVADDDRLNRMMICRLLEKYGNQCGMAEDGKDALDKAFADSYDVVFLDFNMPGYSGPECAEKIRNHCAENKLKQPLLVGVSADEYNVDICGFDDFIAKPFRIERVQEVLNRVTEGVHH